MTSLRDGTDDDLAGRVRHRRRHPRPRPRGRRAAPAAALARGRRAPAASASSPSTTTASPASCSAPSRERTRSSTSSRCVRAAQGRGTAGSLLTEWERRAADAGATRSLAGENLRTYAWPGVDVRYTAALALLLRRGYVRTQTVYNMDLPLDRPVARAADGARAAGAAGIVVRRGRRETARRSGHTPSGCGRRSGFGRRRPPCTASPPPIFLALRDDRVVGFAAHGIHRPSLYGPIATDPDEQGNGIGAVLSALCLEDMAARGVRTAQIGWVAETAIPFYSRTAGARLGRCFWMMARPLTEQEDRG